MNIAIKAIGYGLVGGAIGFAAGYIYDRERKKRTEGIVVYSPAVRKPEQAEMEENKKEVEDQMKKLGYLPSDETGWRRVSWDSGDEEKARYIYYVEDEVLADENMEIVDDDLFQKVLDAHSADPEAKRMTFMEPDSVEWADIRITHEDFATAFNRNAAIGIALVTDDEPYPEEE